MFENLSHLALQQYWWFIIALLGSALVFMMFVQGGQTLIKQIASDETERSMLINTIGKKWDLTFTTLVTFGGAFFASFPLFYSTSFGGAYWVWIIILFSFVIQAVSYEFRTKPENLLGQKTYDTFLFINGFLGTILIGAAVGTFFTGSEFSVDKMRITGEESTIISRWENVTRGLEAALNITNIALGLSVFFLARILALLYFMSTINDDNIFEKSRKHLLYNSIPFLGFFLLFVGLLLTSKGFAVNPETKVIFMEPFKYLHNFIQMPWVFILFLLGVIFVLTGIFMGFVKKSTQGIWYSGAGTILTVLSLFFVAGYNNTSFYPSVFDLQSSLTIENSSSSHYTLTVMSYVSLFVPFIIAYIVYAWKSLTSKKIDRNEIETSIDKY